MRTRAMEKFLIISLGAAAAGYILFCSRRKHPVYTALCGMLTGGAALLIASAAGYVHTDIFTAAGAAVFGVPFVIMCAVLR